MNPAEHLEHVEHNAHASSSFDKRVAVTVAIIAALLATFHSIERHAEAVSLKREIEAGKEKTAASDQWGYYQATNIRDHMYQSMVELSQLLPPSGNDAARSAAVSRWSAQHEKYEKNLKDLKAKAEGLENQSEQSHHQSEDEHHAAVSVGRSTLFLELGIVVTSLAVLTRRSLFWVLGIVLGLAGTGYGLYVVVPHYLAKGH